MHLTKTHSRSILREFHIWNFGNKESTIKLKRNLLNYVKKEALGKDTNIQYGIMFQAIRTNRFPLYILKEILKSYNQEKVESQIVAYKAYRGRTWIKNPILPIKESKLITEILGHILGDGSISIKKGHSSTYTNTSKKLINEFKRICKKAFGTISLTTCIDKRFDAQTVILPQPLVKVLVNFYPEIINKEFPKRLKELPKEHQISFIRAVADDEACVTTSAIVYTLKNKDVLDEIRNLHLGLGFKEEWLSEVKKKASIHVFSIKGEGLLYFNKFIGFKHSEKQKLLGVEVKRKTEKRKVFYVDQTKKEIGALLDKPKTIKELSEIINVQQTRIRKHIKSLLDQGYVDVIKKIKYNVLLFKKTKSYKSYRDIRKEKILNMLSNETLSTLDISKNLNVSKDTTLVFLHELKGNNQILYKEKGKTYLWSLK
jgi:DNA-binding transcriptional ArsR family regulator